MRLPIPPPGLSGTKEYTIKEKTESITTPGFLSEIEGVVDGHRDGHGFVRPDAGGLPIYLPPEEMRAVMHRDRVRVRVLRVDRKGRPEGRVLDILERRRAPIIGRLLLESGQWIVAPEDRRYGRDILIPKNATATALAGQVVAVELTEPPSLHARPVGRVVEVLGDIDDPGMEIEIAVRKFEVPHRFSAQTLAAAAALPDRIRAADRRHRVDLRDLPLVTIDGEDARDFDDAVYCEPFRRGRGKSAMSGWRLIVAIADVSHYVRPGEPIDDDAYERATSVYFPRRVIPMLPEKLSNGLCSLNPGEERLTLVCDMLVADDGSVDAYQFYPAVISSHARLTYTEVAAALTNTRGVEAQRQGELLPHLLHLHEVYRALLRQRETRGAMDFETVETQIVCDEQGRIERIVPRPRTEAHRLIEEAMLAANVCAAQFIHEGAHAALYRVHEGPTPEKRVTLQNYLRALGIGVSIGEDPKPREIAAIAQLTAGRPDAAQIHMMLLRSMQQAVYTATNAGHFGLAYEAYTHFTSPIRRYPDLLVHRVIKALLAGRRYHLAPHEAAREAAHQGAPQERGSRRGGKAAAPRHAAQTHELELWEAAGVHCSANERRADEATRDVEAWLKCRFMREHLGEQYGGTVSAVTSFGLFVTLDELYVEGLVHITELGGDYYRFDEVRQELRGERSGVRFAIGMRVQVQVSRVDLDARRIDFRLVRERHLPLARGARAAAAADELEALREADRTAKAQSRERLAQAKSGAAGARKPSRAHPASSAAGKSRVKRRSRR